MQKYQFNLIILLIFICPSVFAETTITVNSQSLNPYLIDYISNELKSQGREIDEDGNPLKGWNGKPKVNVEDHTWLEVRFKPSYKTFVFDPSFAICNVTFEEIYSFEGRMHISGKNLNFSEEYVMPERLL
mgnify:CR=1 FL=1